jgi:protein-tyrosine phosphatase
MIDLHCHLLPNIDDGPKTWEESLEMASIAHQDGIKGAVMTPHWIQGTNWEPKSSTVIEKVNEFNIRLLDAGIDFKVYPGMEIGITANLAEFVSSGRILTLAEGECLLLEIPFYSLPYGLEEIINSLRKIGKKAILAHPERGKEFQENPARILDFKELGALVQITAGSFRGDFGDKAKKCALEFAKMGVLDIVSSDAHSTRRRRPIVSSGLKVLEAEIGSDKIDEIIENSYNVIGLKSTA